MGDVLITAASLFTKSNLSYIGKSWVMRGSGWWRVGGRHGNVVAETEGGLVVCRHCECMLCGFYGVERGIGGTIWGVALLRELPFRWAWLPLIAPHWSNRMEPPAWLIQCSCKYLPMTKSAQKSDNRQLELFALELMFQHKSKGDY